MLEFHRIAEEIAGQIRERASGNGISPSDLPKIVSTALGRQKFNVYPGESSDECHELAFFISLSSPTLIKGKRGHLSCRKAIEKVVQHMQGNCIETTRIAILITDSWDALAADEWGSNLRQISRMAHIEMYLIAGKKVSCIYL
ncbi:MAG: hypothetical protein PWR18_942 [Synergistales bacterium]|nr:hypothetical protein [Synergistales bacterium]